tara:strand:+ start:70421 stop:71875 length:1455 start_codon:yes stop_codon:yes gene_type:complete
MTKIKENTIKYILIILAVIFLHSSCEKNDNLITTENDVINLFVWRAMNTYYLWQENVPDLSDTRFTSLGQLYSTYSIFPSPTDVFQNLLHHPGVIDRFSWIEDDYVALENSFQGINLSNGMEFGLVRYENNPSNIFGYVRYVIPGSDAELNGVTRGMLFSEVDGFQLTESNYTELLFDESSSYTISLAEFNNGNPIPNSNILSLNKNLIQENPIAITKTIDEGAHKIGYLLYNQFSSTFDAELNTAFATFKSENITDLIIDLRYNGGGKVSTATYLGGMITGQFNGQLFSKELWNSKVQNALDADLFENNFTNQLNNGVINETLNNLNMTNVYFITTKSTASASELVMNSLSAYIDVKSVGTKTLGKVQGSVTLYDSDNFSRTGDNLNPNHTWALQPLVLEIQNKNNFNEPAGISPTVELKEDYNNLGILGERSDPLLDRTIILITTGARSNNTMSNNIKYLEEISNSQINYPIKNNMFIDLKK